MKTEAEIKELIAQDQAYLTDCLKFWENWNGEKGEEYKNVIIYQSMLPVRIGTLKWVLGEPENEPEEAE